MTQFGQGTPALPQIFRDVNPYQFTKAGFVSRLVAALRTVGMIPLSQSWPWDPVADPEFAAPDPTVAVFPFDYPDTATFSFNNTLWRPCVVLCVWFGDYSIATTTTASNNYLVLFDAIRPNGAFNINTMVIFEKERTPGNANFGFGVGSATFSSTHPDTQGSEVFVANWKPYAAFGGLDQTTLGVGNTFAYLGPAGLFVYVGTGTSYNQFGDLMAVGFGFGGARIPGRELIPDVDLNHICPVFPMYTRATGSGSDMYDTSTGRLRTLTHGIQYLGKSQQFPTRAYLYNLENLERPVYSQLTPYSVPSPRAVSGGGGAHILGRIVIVPNDKENNTGDFYSRVESSLTTGETRPVWGEVYTCPSLRFCDRTAPLGDHEDPITLTNWYLVPHYSTLSLIGLKSENAVMVSATSVGTLTQVGENFYTTIGTPTTGNALTFPNLGGGITAPVCTTAVTNGTQFTANTSIGSGQASTGWDCGANGAADQLLCTTVTAGTAGTATMVWTAQQSGTDTDDTVYKIQFQWKNAGGAATEGFNRCEFSRFFQGSFVILSTLLSGGTNVSNPSFSFQTVVISLTLDSTVTTQKNLKFQWVVTKSNTNAGNAVTVKDIRVQKYRYL